jgi:TonB family protein
MVMLIAAVARADVVDDWRRALDDAAQDLKNHDYARVERSMGGVIKGFRSQLGGGSGAPGIVARSLFYLALEEQGLGRSDDALWHWHVAIAIHPPIEHVDLESFGSPGVFLALHPPAEECDDCSDGDPPDDAVIEPPVVRKRPRVRYPRGAGRLREEGTLIVQVVIERDGSVTRPRVLQALPAPMLTLVALEGVREWEFEPATLNGEPVSVYYNLSVNYDVRH